LFCYANTQSEVAIINHKDQHEKVQQEVTSLIALHRGYLGVEEKWQIQIQILCKDHPEITGLMEWIPDTYQATLSIRCNLSYALLRWETIHELVELSRYKTGTAVCQFVEQCYDMRDAAQFFMSQYRIFRNQEIEREVERYLAEKRPCGGSYGTD
jgi:hypothetical protein